ncbi:hypothetical protein ILUMI_01397 [Ignelater luminosus]|uniref:Uncharacterized protein n=1 Tax=Ignelater luminosus TaxID=2038154 RepID=A0A8K0DJS7_IGNLU|nr:hypothetical protein ILUMI_01397 [Ignelater luminosus]
MAPRGMEAGAAAREKQNTIECPSAGDEEAPRAGRPPPLTPSRANPNETTMQVKNEGAVLKFVKTSESEPMPEPSGVSSLEASAAQNQEEAEVVQVPDTDDLLRPVIGSTNLSASHASAAIAEINFDGNDIGNWPENIDSNIRLLLIQRGPEVTH